MVLRMKNSIEAFLVQGDRCLDANLSSENLEKEPEVGIVPHKSLSDTLLQKQINHK